MDEFKVTPGTLRSAASRLATGSGSLSGASQSFLASVSDPSVLGNRDAFGGIASAVYASLFNRLSECLATVPPAMSGHAGLLEASASDYEAEEASHIDAIKGVQG